MARRNQNTQADGVLANHSRDLLPKGDILKNEFVMSTAGGCKRGTEQQNQVQHAVDSVVPHRLNQPVNRSRRNVAKDTIRRLAIALDAAFARGLVAARLRPSTDPAAELNVCCAEHGRRRYITGRTFGYRRVSADRLVRRGCRPACDRPEPRRTAMPYVTVGKENSADIELYYEDHGSGKPVVLIHGYPLSGASWEKQVPALLNAGHRVITYDRRGFGKSSQPTDGYNYGTFAEDLRKLLAHLALQDFTLVGFSMGGGEIARFFGRYGSSGARSAVIIGGVPPFLLKTADNSEGLDASVFEGIKKAVAADRYAFFTGFFKNFFNTDVQHVSEEVVRASWNIAAGASATASVACVPTWHEDFRQDVARIDVPTLVIHGDADRIVPLEAAGARTAKLVRGARLVVINGGPHCVTWTHADAVNAELVKFLGAVATT
jgi:non-heme chloroperoxidase